MVSHSIGNLYRSVVTVFQSPPTESQFLSEGKLTPEEFLTAGEQLVHRCPTWAWQPAAAGYQQNRLPLDCQFLVARGVPSRRRISQIGESEMTEKETEDGWLVTELLQEHVVLEEIKKEEESPIDENAVGPLFSRGYMVTDEPEETVQRTRVYDLSVTYDSYYLTPRLWLVGYNEFMHPLSPDEMFEDIMDDYAHKTTSVERHPALGNHQISIHPCNHAKMMKTFVDIILQNGGEPQVHQALFVFLKFLSSVVPTIEYDFTMDFSLK